MEAPLWSEYIWDPRRLDYQLFPRLLACAEVGWSLADRKDYADFESRVKGMLRWFDMRQIGYAPPSEWDSPSWKRLAAFFKIRQPKTRIPTGNLPLP
jgi:N-acetyl-beta-hexosaminidase